jgi:hypothetical protein
VASGRRRSRSRARAARAAAAAARGLRRCSCAAALHATALLPCTAPYISAQAQARYISVSLHGRLVRTCIRIHRKLQSWQTAPLQDEGATFFATTMVDFLTRAEATAATLKADVAQTMAELQALYGYFGEKYDGNDPVRILSTVATFLDMFAKTIAAMQARACGHADLRAIRELRAQAHGCIAWTFRSHWHWWCPRSWSTKACRRC